MDERVKFIAECTEEISFSQLCRKFGISRKTGYKWLKRYNRDGVDGLKERAPVAVRFPHRTSQALVDELVATRKAHPFWGPRKIRELLSQQAAEKTWPASSTIGEILKRYGLIRPRRRRVRVPLFGSPLDPCELPNDVWCADFKGHFLLGDSSRCYPLTISDGATRYLIRCEGLHYCAESYVKEHFDCAFREFGLPNRIRSDNGAPFASTAPGGLSTLSIWWVKLGIIPERIEPGHPEQNGRHERMHRTLKLEATQPAEHDLSAQQRRFDLFRREYNEVRPHEALDLQVPAKRYEPSHRPYPSELLVPEYPNGVVRWVSSSGAITWRCQTISVGRPLASEPVGFIQRAESCWELFYGPIRLGYVDDREKTIVLHRQALVLSPTNPDSSQQSSFPIDRRLRRCVTPYVGRKRSNRDWKVPPRRPV